MLWQSCPGFQVTCPSRPLMNARVDFTPQGGGHASETKTDSSGSYHLDLPAGRYTVTLPDDQGLLLNKGPEPLTVNANTLVRADYTFRLGLH